MSGAASGCCSARATTTFSKVPAAMASVARVTRLDHAAVMAPLGNVTSAGADTMSGHARVDSRVRRRPPVVDLITE